MLAAAVIVVGTILWLQPDPWSAKQFLAITTITNGAGQFSYIFCVTNASEYPVFLVDAVVQVRVAEGWRTSNQFQVESPNILRGGRSKEVVADIPQNPGTFRFGVLYAPEARYPRLLTIRLNQAISSRSLEPLLHSKSLDFMGSNMCFSAEVLK